MSDLKKNVWELDGWYDQTVAGDGSYYADNTFWSWGDNQNGALGQNQSAPVLVSSPTQIPGTTWSKIAQGTGYNWHMAIKTDGTLWSWGYNGYGGLGQNAGPGGGILQYSSPVQIPGTTWNKVAISQRHFLAIKTDGTLWTAGSNQMGELGQNKADVSGGDTTDNSYSSPIQIPGTWTDVGTGTNRSHGIKTDGTLWSWGRNANGGPLGLNNNTQYSSPTQIHGGGTNWVRFATSHDNAMAAIKTDGTLWTWGRSNHYNLPSNSDRSSPIQVPGTTWSQVSGSYSSWWATKTDGTLWSWGNNPDGQLGQNNRTQYSSPVQIGTNTNWSKVRSGMNMCFFRTTGNALFAVGNGGNGRLGNKGTANVSSPVIIGGGAWSDVGGYYNTHFGIREW